MDAKAVVENLTKVNRTQTMTKSDAFRLASKSIVVIDTQIKAISKLRYSSCAITCKKWKKFPKKCKNKFQKNNRYLKGEIKPPGSTKFILVLFLPSYLNGAMNMLYTSTSMGGSVGNTPACGPRDLASSPAWENKFE